MTSTQSQGASRRPGWAGGILAIGIVLSGATFLALRQSEARRASGRFEIASRQAQERLETSLLDVESLLNGVKGLSQAKGGLTRTLFRDFVRAKQLERWYPGVQAVAYVPPEPEGRIALEARLRREHGDSSLSLHPGTGFGDDAVVLFEEPEAANRSALGFNSASHPDQWQSLVDSRDSGRMRITAPVALAQAPAAGTGLVMWMPLYEGGGAPDSRETRRKAFRGYANAVLLVSNLAQEAFGQLARVGIRGRLVDVGDLGPRPMAEGGTEFARRWWHLLAPGPFQTVRRIDMGGRSWELRCEAGPSFCTLEEACLPWGVALLVLQSALLVAGLVKAITRQKRVAQELAERMTAEFHRSESRLRAITRVLPDLVLVIDQEGRYLEVFGHDPDLLRALPGDLERRTVWDVLPPELAPRVMEVIRKTLQEGRVQSLEYTLEVPRGVVRFEARVSPLDDAEGGVPAVIWATRDVSAQRAQDEHLQQLQKLESLSVLAGGIARDFSNLSAALRRHLGLGRLGLAEGTDPSHHFEQAEGFARRASELAQQLLAYSSQPVLSHEAFSLNALAEEALAEVCETRGRNLQFELDLDSGLPQVQGDREQVRHSVSGLLANACEAMGETGGRVSIRTRLAFLDAEALSLRMPGQELAPGRYLGLEIEDEGCGMSPEILARVFDPFFTTKPTGRGLGLAALRSVLRAHGAGIEVDSELGRGTRMVLHFPART